VKIVIHTQFYPPEMGAPQARLSDLARRLSAMGWTVEILTAMPNYPTGEVFEGYGGFHREEVRDGLRIHRAWIFPSNRPGLLHRLASYLSFCASSLAVGLLTVRKPDVVMTESPPLFLAMAGYLLAWLKGARWVMNVSDLWPESAAHLGLFREKSTAYRVMGMLARYLYGRAWLITGQSAEIVERIEELLPSSPCHHLSNGVDVHSFSTSLRSEEVRGRYLRPDEVGFVYAGLHGLFQGLDQILEAAVDARDLPIRFILFGDGPVKSDLERKAGELGLAKVSFHPPLPHGEIPGILASMDVAMITLTTTIRGAVPSKIYEAMASGIPILLVAGGEARRIVEDAEAGLVVSPGDREGIGGAVVRLAGDVALRARLGANGRRVAEERYDREVIARAFEGRLHRGSHG
jgi:glycosyltransferase involved in cell wall biosynthesis